MRIILPVIVIAQFFCTSLWFAGNSIISDLARGLQLQQNFLAHITSVIQFGFITGTLIFAVLSVSDRYSPSKVFFFCSVLASVFNLGPVINGIGAVEVLLFRFITGFLLAGIYPVGMKIVSDYYQAGLGKSLGFLVGALVAGTAFPHLLKNLAVDFPWRNVLYTTSALCLIGGLSVLLLVPDGPYRKPGQKIKLTAFATVFRKREFRSVVFGYFGHMWELYTFWAFVPVMLSVYNKQFPDTGLNVSLFSFAIICSGALACVLSGVLSQYLGVRKIVTLALLISCLCCLLSPWFLFNTSPLIFLVFLFIWGISVIADSPLFSTLVAQNAPDEFRGTSLTIVNCIGFAITIVSIQFINLLSDHVNEKYIYVFLAIGPVLGLISLVGNKSKPIVIVTREG